MNRRTFHRTLLGSAAYGRTLLGSAATSFYTSSAQDAPETARHYTPDWSSLNGHSVPEWFDNAKLGIFVHWGLYSVPAWATPTGELGHIGPEVWFKNNPYAEWYLNTLRIKNSPTYEHHLKTYGKDFDYYRFSETFNKDVQKWNPDTWADTFKKTGARYVVLTTKHHDGFTLWPTQVVNPKRSGLAATRDLVGDLTRSVRDHGMKMGLYYSGGLDWTFTKDPLQSRKDFAARIPQSAEYAAYADAHWMDLIRRYQPSVLWNDIAYPRLGKLEEIFSDYYNTVPDGVINNRFTIPYSDYTTPEYAKYDRITQKKWESCRGLGFSFGYNQVEGPEQVIAPDKLIALFVDIVSKNGNLLLNVGPRADGSISDIQLDRLQKLGAWLSANGEGIFDSKPSASPGGKAGDGTDVRFTTKGESAYAFVLSRPEHKQFPIPDGLAGDGMRMEKLGNSAPLEWKQNGHDLTVSVSGDLPAQFGIKLTPKPWQIVGG